MSLSRLNDLFSKNDCRFKSLEFERGLGIVEDAFYLTVELGGQPIITKIVTNLRCIRKDNTMVRYSDLFLTTSGKKISKREFRSQRDIEKTALKANLDLFNNIFGDKFIRSFKFSPCGDFKVSFSSSEFIVANDDLDVSKRGRHLYEILFVDSIKPYVVVVSECGRTIKVSKKTKVELYPEQDGHGMRFIIV